MPWKELDKAQSDSLTAIVKNAASLIMREGWEERSTPELEIYHIGLVLLAGCAEGKADAVQDELEKRKEAEKP